MYAERDFKKGEVIFAEQPLATACTREDRCGLCLRALPKHTQLQKSKSHTKTATIVQLGVGCRNNCPCERYCSSACADRAWSLYHRALCGSDLPKLRELTRTFGNLESSKHLLLITKIVGVTIQHATFEGFFAQSSTEKPETDKSTGKTEHKTESKTESKTDSETTTSTLEKEKEKDKAIDSFSFRMSACALPTQLEQLMDIGECKYVRCLFVGSVHLCLIVCLMRSLRWFATFEDLLAKLTLVKRTCQLTNDHPLYPYFDFDWMEQVSVYVCSLCVSVVLFKTHKTQRNAQHRHWVVVC